MPGVIVLVGDYSTGYFGRVVGRTRDDGTYALFEFSAANTNDYPVRALDIATGRSAIQNAATSGTLEENFYQGLVGYQTLRANLLLPPRGGGNGGEPPPSLTVYGLSSNLPPEQDSLYSRGIATVGQTVTIVARSNRPLPQITGTALIGGVETRQLTWTEHGANTYIAPLTVSAEGSYHLKVTARASLVIRRPRLSRPTTSSVCEIQTRVRRYPSRRPLST